MRQGGIGSTLIDQPEGLWCSYWHQQGGAVQIIPRNNLAISDTGVPLEMTPHLREFLGQLAGLPPAPSVGIVIPHFGLVEGAAMVPIKMGVKKKKEEPMMVDLSSRNILGEDEVEEDKDSQLVSRSEHLLHLLWDLLLIS